MEKTKISKPFGPWHWNLRDAIQRSAGDTKVTICLSNNRIYSSVEIVPVTYAPNLSEAIARVDSYIANNFEVEKPVEERLKDAEAEIVTLKAKVAELESKPKFQIGQFLTYYDGSWGNAKYEVGRPIKTAKGYAYEFKSYPNISYPENKLKLAE